MTDQTSSAPAPGKTLLSIQVLRGFAAAAVAIYHTRIILLKPEYGGYDLFGTVASRGWLGVNFFFVLSGFIIVFAHARDIGRPALAPRYLWRRFVRVYPIYWIFTLVYVGAALAGMGYPDFGWDARNLIASATLLMVDPAPLPPLQVAWTLFYEVFFYLFFLALILNRRFGTILFAAWMALVLFCSLGLGMTEMGPFHMWNIHFALGMAAYWAFRRLEARWTWPLLIAGVAAVAVLLATGVASPHMVDAQHDPTGLMLVAIAFAVLLAGITLWERDRVWRPAKPLLLLGDASYAVYLVHSPVLSFIAHAHAKLPGPPLPPVPLFFVAAILSIVAGVMAHLVVEKPLLRLLRMRVGRSDPAPRPQPAELA